MFFETLTIVITLISLIGYYNFFTTTTFKQSKQHSNPSVSILIPVRNEEENIAKCIESCLKQNYENYEIIICDDQSEDNTKKKISNYLKNPTIKLIEGKKLEEGWIGKSWACHQLSQKAKGDLLLFIDADVTIEPETLNSSISLMEKKEVDLLSFFPLQIMNSIGEWLTIPIFEWMVFTFIPLNLIYKIKSPKLSLAIGQFILIKRKTYENIEGHKKVSLKKAEDAAMAREVKKINGTVMLAKSKKMIKCKMYDGLLNSFNGLSRSFYDGANMKPLTYISSLSIIIILFLIIPIYILLINPLYIISYIPLFIQRILTAILSGQNVIKNILLMPLHMIILVLIAMNSINISLRKKVTWKGRKI